MVAAIVAQRSRSNMAYFSILAFVGIVVMLFIGNWYNKRLCFIPKLKTMEKESAKSPLPLRKTIFTIVILLILIFSKHVYVASLTNYYTFYMIEKFGVTVQASQICLFIFLAAAAIGTFMGGPSWRQNRA